MDGSGDPEAIFVVGVSRSGTTLMRRILDSHSRVAIATETHYLGHLLAREGARCYFRRLGPLTDDRTIGALVAFLHDGSFQRASWLREVSPFWRWLVREVPSAELERRLLEAERTERGVFRAMLQAYADRRGKQIPGEKTPAHLAWAQLLLAWFPGARVIHMVRDPRAVYASEVRRRADVPGSLPYRALGRSARLQRTFILHEVAWAWASAVHQHRALQVAFPGQYRAVRFEDLVRHPEPVMADVLAWLGVPWEPGVLRQRIVSRGQGTPGIGIDAAAADRWRSQVSGPAGRWLTTLLGPRLPEMGYGT